MQLSVLPKIVLSISLLFTNSKITDGNIEHHCLVANVYYEARGEPLVGQLAIALVTINRANRGICNAVYAKSQFSWTRRYVPGKRDIGAWNNAENIATLAQQYSYNFHVTHYHNKTVNPNWNLTYLFTINNHLFYK